jgi:hypothetical protein
MQLRQPHPALPELHVALAVPDVQHPGRGGGPPAVCMTPAAIRACPSCRPRMTRA